MADQPATATRPDGRPLPDQVTMGLLAYLTAHAVDDDYAEVAARRTEETTTRSRRRIGLVGAAALAVAAVFVVTAAVQTSRDSGTQQRERRALIDQVKDGKASVEADRRTIATLQTETDRLESEWLSNTHDASGVIAERNLLALRSGTSAVHGPGLEIVVDDAEDAESDRNKVLYSDLQQLVNGLWRAGAEAISINGERLTALSAIRNAGDAITVNFRKLSRPYRILVIGNRETLPSLFADTTSGQTWLDVQREVGLRFTMRKQSSLRLPAADVPVLRYAAPPETLQGKRSS